MKYTSEEQQIKLLNLNSYNFTRFKNPSEKVQQYAVSLRGSLIFYISNPSTEVQRLAILNDGMAAYHIENPSADLRNDPEVIRSIKKTVAMFIKNGINEDVIIRYMERVSKFNIPELEKIAAAIVKHRALSRKPITESAHYDYYDDMTEEQQIKLVNYIPASISGITNPSERVQLTAVSIDGDVIKHIPNPSKEVKLAAVRNRGRAILYIENPDEDIKRTAVTENGYSIRYIPNPSLIVQMTAIDEASDAIRYIKNPTEQIQLYAVNKASYSIEDIEFPTTRVQRTAILRNAETVRLIRNIDAELFNEPEIKTSIIKRILELVKENDIDPLLHMIRVLNDNMVDWPEMERLNKIPDIMVRKPITETRDYNSMSEEEQIRKVFATYGYIIKDIPNPSERVQLAVVQLTGFFIQYIYQKGIEPSEQVKRAALENNGNAIAYIPNPSEELQIIAVRNAGDSIAEIQEAGIIPSRRVMEEAVKSHPWSIVYMQPDDNLQRLALMNDPLLIPRIPNLNLSLLEEDTIKRQIIKGILQGIQAGKTRTVEWAVSFLEKHGVQWPELEKIKSVLNRKGIS